MSQPSTPMPSPDACSLSTLSSPMPSQENTPDTSAGSSTTNSSLLYTSLIGTVNSPFAANAEMLVNIPINNNPHPLHSVFNDGANYWVGPDGNVLRLMFLVKLHLEGRYNKSGEYFNLPETGLDLADITNAKIQFEVLPLDDKEKNCPVLVIGCSQFAMTLLYALHSEAEEAHNALLDAGTIPLNVPFWRTYKEDDKYSLVVMAGAAFKDVPDLKTAMTPQMSRAEAIKCAGLMSPSKARANAKKFSQVLDNNEGKKSNSSSWHICDLKDSRGQYSALLNTYDLHGTRVQSPDDRDEHSVHIHVSDYKTKLKEGMIVELEVILKLWNIKPRRDNPNPRNVNGSHIYQIMLQHMQLLPCTKYTQPIFVDSLKDRKGKRKATDEMTGQSPTKKGSFTGVSDKDELEYTMVK
ncbi:uncharacterized protein EDB91DRAFT_1088475 [Suillus paluster]|uniref:uncharacterized protein n=1 Tax=Suillus paluster TaxID=48578 RepID=UPI001B873FC8|nr:uncharacterized protein EDB91DRAFT_1088475 [Suillus paluster]KAG1721369.1 hypothetical protein EDB91DRAFT_1088475 [Suillus paluster]